MQANSKAILLKSIKQAELARLDEQRIYRAIISSALNTPATEKHEKLLKELGEDGIAKHMCGESWPPDGQDWKLLRGVEWDEISKQKILSKIEDEEIRHATYFYSEIAEHTLRLKALAHFYSLFGANNEKIYSAFIGWQVFDTLKAIQRIDEH